MREIQKGGSGRLESPSSHVVGSDGVPHVPLDVIDLYHEWKRVDLLTLCDSTLSRTFFLVYLDGDRSPDVSDTRSHCKQSTRNQTTRVRTAFRVRGSDKIYRTAQSARDNQHTTIRDVTPDGER